MKRQAKSKLCPRVRAAAWRWTIYTMRDILWRVDEWVHEQEVKIREGAR